MDFNALKYQYQKRIEDIQREKNELENNVSKVLNELEKIITIYHNANPLLHNVVTNHSERKLNELIDFLKLNGFKNYNDLNEKTDQLLENSRDITGRLERLKAELKEEFITCPDCKGGRYKKVPTIIDLEGRKEITYQIQKCTLCDGRGKIPTKELLDC